MQLADKLHINLPTCNNHHKKSKILDEIHWLEILQVSGLILLIKCRRINIQMS